MKRLSPIVLVVLIVGLLCACRRDEAPTIDFGYNYLPLEVGSWIEYDVDSVVFDEFNASVDTFHFIMREECVEQFEDLEGRSAYRFERFQKEQDTASFRYVTTFYIVTDGVRSERVEGNVRTVPLTYPPTEREDWDANAFNNKPEQEYQYEEVDQAWNVNGLAFDSTLRVIQQNDTDNFIIKRYAEERYARNVGLISREYFHIETQFNIDSGLHWIQAVRDHSF